jgi:hypothetical protein
MPVNAALLLTPPRLDDTGIRETPRPVKARIAELEKQNNILLSQKHALAYMYFTIPYPCSILMTSLNYRSGVRFGAPRYTSSAIIALSSLAAHEVLGRRRKPVHFQTLTFLLETLNIQLLLLLKPPVSSCRINRPPNNHGFKTHPQRAVVEGVQDGAAHA